MVDINLLLGSIFLILPGLPSLLIFVEFLLGQKQLRARPDNSGARKPCTVLIPAHNEELVIEQTLLQLGEELSPGDRVVVIADNCTDRTVSICESLGVEALERCSVDERGKGFALDFGIQHISDQMPATVVILDADSEFEPGGLAVLVSRSQVCNAVVQAMYLMRAPSGAPIKIRLAEFAWLVKNRIRPAGLSRLGFGCHLQGSGMAFPARVFNKVSLASSSIVEDLELGLKLTALGCKIKFEPGAVVHSSFPTSADGAESQRTRWEHGHLGSMALLPRMMLAALKKRQFRAMGLYLDAGIPPTIMWLALVVLVTGVAGLLTLLSVTAPLYVSLFCLAGLLSGIALSWLCHGRALVKVTDLRGIIGFALGKFTIYKRFFSARQKEWVRTDRSSEGRSDAKRDEGP